MTGNPNWTTREGDNYNGVRIDTAIGQRLFNNTIRNYGGDTDTGGGGIDHNHSGLTTYKWEDLTVENNVFENCGAGIYLKATQTTTRSVGTNLIRFNQFINNSKGIQVHRAPNTAADPILILQNVFRSNVSGVRILMFNDATDPTHVKMINNTFDSQTDTALVIGTSGNMPANAGYVWWNNIVVGGPRAVTVQHPVSDVTPAKIDAEHNMYFGMGTMAEVGGSNMTFGAWQGLNQDTNDGGTADGVFGVNPQFVAAQDYRLQSGSAARALGRVHPAYIVGGSPGATIPAGAYITGSEDIGLTNGTTTPPPPPPPPGAPAAPTNVRVIR